MLENRDFLLGVELAQRFEWRAAAGYFTRCLESPHFRAGTHYNLGIAHWHLAEHDEARKCLESAVRLEPGNSQYLEMLARLGAWSEFCHLQMGGQILARGRLQLTPFGPHHSPAAWALLRDPEVRSLAGAPDFATPAEVRRWAAWLPRSTGQQLFAAVEHEHGVIGVVTLSGPATPAGTDAYFSYWIGKHYQRRGLGLLALQLLVELAARKGIGRLWSFVDSANEASKRALEKAGFTARTPSRHPRRLEYARNVPLSLPEDWHVNHP